MSIQISTEVLNGNQEFIYRFCRPLLYDDAMTYDGTVIPMKGVYTDGKMRAGTAPTHNDDVVRLQDLPGALIPGVSVVTGARAVGVVYQNANSTMIRAAISITFEP